MKRILVGMGMLLWATIAHAQSIGGTSGISNSAQAGSATGTCTPGTAAMNFLARTSGLSTKEGQATCDLINAAVAHGWINGNLSGAAGCGTVISLLYVPATNNATTAALNWCGTGNTLSAVSTPCTFTKDRGYTGTGTCEYETGFDGAGLTNFQENSASLGAYVLNSRTVGDTSASIGTITGTNASYIGACGTSPSCALAYDLNGQSFLGDVQSPANAQGFGITTRINGSTVAGYKNGVNTGIHADSATAAPFQNLWVMCLNAGMGACNSMSNSVDTIAAAFAGGNVSAYIGYISCDINAYMTELGVNTYTNPASCNSSGTYTGLGASRTGMFASFLNATPKQAQTRTIHRAAVAYGPSNPLIVVFGNWYINQSASFAEAGPGATASATWGVEYPLDNISCTAGTFSSSATGTISNGGNLNTDPLSSISIPVGAYFGIRLHYSSTAGVIYNDGNDLHAGEAMTVGTTVTDQTATCGAVTSSNDANNLFPLAIIGKVPVGQPSVFVAGDSRVHGLPPADSYANDTFGDVGEVTRALGAAGPNWGYVNGGVGGDAVGNYQGGNYAKRMAIANAYSTSMITQTATNDFYVSGASAATVTADWQNIWPLYTGKVIYATTVPPETTFAGNAPCTTVGGQTPGSGNTARVAWNDALRAGTVPGITGVFDVTSAVESSLDSGVWATPGGMAITNDSPCVHESYSGDQLILNSGVINTSKLK